MRVKSTYQEFGTVEDMLADILKREGEDALFETILLRREAGLCAQCSKIPQDQHVLCTLCQAQWRREEKR